MHAGALESAQTYRNWLDDLASYEENINSDKQSSINESTLEVQTRD